MPGWAYQWLVQAAAGRGTAGRRRWTCSGCGPRRSRPRSRSSSSRRSSPGGPAARRGGGARCSSSTPATACGLAARPGRHAGGLLIRLRSNRHFLLAPVPGGGAPTGRPRRNGAKFVCDDPATWPAPTAELPQRRRLRPGGGPGLGGAPHLRAAPGAPARTLPPPHATSTGRGARGGRPPAGAHAARPRSSGCGGSPPGRARRRAAARPGRSCGGRTARRYDIEHTFRFLKQDLHWVTPAGAPAGAGRPLDLARRRRVHPAAPGPRRRGRPAPALGAPAGTRRASRRGGCSGLFRRCC